MTSATGENNKKRSIVDFLRPHWKALTLALLAVVGGSGADLAQPWPLKIVLDYLLQSKKPPPWMAVPLRWIGPEKLAVLNFAVLAVAVTWAAPPRASARRGGRARVEHARAAGARGELGEAHAGGARCESSDV